MCGLPMSRRDLSDLDLPLIISLLQELVLHFEACATSEIELLDFDRLVSTAMPFGKCIGMTVGQAKETIIIKRPNLQSSRHRPSWQWQQKTPTKAKTLKKPEVRLTVVEVISAILFGPGNKFSHLSVSGLVHCRASLASPQKLRIGLRNPNICDVKTTTFTDYDENNGDIVTDIMIPGRGIAKQKASEKLTSSSEALKTVISGDSDADGLSNSEADDKAEIVLCTYLVVKPKFEISAKYKILNFSKAEFTSEVWIHLPNAQQYLKFEVRIPLGQASFKTLRIDQKSSGHVESPGSDRCALWRPLASGGSTKGDAKRAELVKLTFTVRLSQPGPNRGTVPKDDPTSYVVLRWMQVQCISGIRPQLKDNNNMNSTLVQRTIADKVILADLDHYSGSSSCTFPPN